jgi:hypothetical protein
MHPQPLSLKERGNIYKNLISKKSKWCAFLKIPHFHRGISLLN